MPWLTASRLGLFRHSHRLASLREILQDAKVDIVDTGAPPVDVADKASTIYTELVVGTNDFRILKIEAATFEEPVKCTLKVVKGADEFPEYCALSYTWGTVRPANVITINDQPFTVTPNCESALRHIREEDEPVTIWIDAICINQKDAKDKNAQISRMRDIYASAAQVIVWLGEEDSETPQAFDLLTRIGELGKYDPEKLTSRTFGSSAGWQAVSNIFRREWFERVWIIQEVSLAKSIVIRCGRHSMSWTTWNRAIQWYFDDIGFVNRGIMERDSLFLNAIEVRDTWAERFYGVGDEPGLDYLLAAFGHWKATNLLDKVNALLGMSKDHAAPELQPDYSKSIRQVYANVVKFFITRDKRLDILGQCQNPPSYTELPSWVPDWTEPFAYRQRLSEGYRPKGSGEVKITSDGLILVPMTLHIPDSGYGTWKQAFRGMEEMNFSASIDTLADAYFPTANDSEAVKFICKRGPFPEPEDTMSLKGIEVDTIYSFTRPLYRTEEDVDDPTFFLDWEKFAIFQMPPDVECPHGDSFEERLEAFWRTISTDRIYLDRSNLRAKPICRQLFEQWRAKLVQNANPENAYVPKTAENTDPNSEAALSSLMYEMLARMNLSDYGPDGLLNINVRDPSTIPQNKEDPVDASLLEKYEAWKQHVSQLDYSVPASSETDVIEGYTLANFEATLRTWCYARKLARTTSGRLALVPEHTRHGDRVFILYGGSIPYIARPLMGRHKFDGVAVDKNGTRGPKGASYVVAQPMHQFVGEAYVHGIMDGEAMEYPALERTVRVRAVEQEIKRSRGAGLEGRKTFKAYQDVYDPLTEDQEVIVAAWREALKERERHVWFDRATSDML